MGHSIKELCAMNRVRLAAIASGSIPPVPVEAPVVEIKAEAVKPVWAWRKVDGKQLPDGSYLTGKSPELPGDLASILSNSYGLGGAFVTGTRTGPTVTTHLVELQKGARASGIVSREEDLARDLGMDSVRILSSVAGHYGCIGVEVPNAIRGTVSFKDTYLAYSGKSRLPIILGASSMGSPVCLDLASMPHLLVAGTTGSGKSVFLHTVICSLVSCMGPEDLKLHLVDPKRVEFREYRGLPHLEGHVIHDQHEASKELETLVEQMEDRYRVLERAGAKDIVEYNGLPVVLQHPDIRMPYRVLVVDEFADLMMSGKAGGLIESQIIRLAQKARAVGIHIVLATQKPTVDVISKQIKANMPARIAFKVACGSDSRVILDSNGAESLLGKGDMLVQTEQIALTRVQGAHLDPATIHHIVKAVSP